MNELEKKTAQAIVNIFETGRALGEYGQVTLLAGDSGQLTYGRSQTTLASGNLYLLIKAYCAIPEAAFATQMAPYLPALERLDSALNTDAAFKTLLRNSGDDHVMHDCQDQFFDRVYWQPAMNAAAGLGIQTPLGCATVYDSFIHGAWKPMRDRTNNAPGAPKPAAGGKVDEKVWVPLYIATRRDWLASHSNTLLRKTVYRMDALQILVTGGKWDLALPLTVRGVTITPDVLSGSVVVRASADVVEERLLKLRAPMMQGEDVRALQKALVAAGFAIKDVDGIFGQETDDAVKGLQKAKNLTADGIVGPATKSALKL
jgi:chitosanase